VYRIIETREVADRMTVLRRSYHQGLLIIEMRKAQFTHNQVVKLSEQREVGVDKAKFGK